MEQINIEKEIIKNYDLVLNFDSLLDFKEKGWNIYYGENGKNNYKTSKENNNVIVGVAGNKNRGKSFILRKLIFNSIQTGFLDTTYGISCNFPNLKNEEQKNVNIITLDCAGKETPLLKEKGQENEKDLERTKMKSRDQLICEDIISNFIMEKCTAIIIVMEQLNYIEQIMLENLISRAKTLNKIKKFDNCSFFVVHNLMNLHTKKDIQGFIENTLKKSYTFELSEQKFELIKKENQLDEDQPDENQIFFKQVNTEFDINHIIIGDDNIDEVREYYNDPAILFLKKMIMTKKSKKFDIVNEFMKYITENSYNFLNERLQEKDLVFTGDKIECKKEKSISLKIVNVDERGHLIYIPANIEPPCCYYITKEKDNKYYLNVRAEISGDIKKKEISVEKSLAKDSIALIISGTVNEPKFENCIFSNIKWGSFSFTIQIPKKFEEEKKKEREIEDIKKGELDDRDEKYGRYFFKFELSLIEKEENKSQKATF